MRQQHCRLLLQERAPFFAALGRLKRPQAMSVKEFELFHGAVLTKLLRSEKPVALRLIETRPWEVLIVSSLPSSANWPRCNTPMTSIGFSMCRSATSLPLSLSFATRRRRRNARPFSESRHSTSAPRGTSNSCVFSQPGVPSRQGQFGAHTSLARVVSFR